MAPLLEAAGFAPEYVRSENRKLFVDTPDESTRLLFLRATDVPTYVEYGAADIGFAGSDILDEANRDLIEPLDLGLGQCRLVVACPKDAVSPSHTGCLRVASKYPNLTRQHFRAEGTQIVLIKLYGAVELAAAVGLADRVVDLVSTGATLTANGLVELETIANVSTRVVVNRASLKTGHQDIYTLIHRLRSALS